MYWLDLGERWAQTVSNRRLPLCKSGALPLSYVPVPEEPIVRGHGRPKLSVLVVGAVVGGRERVRVGVDAEWRGAGGDYSQALPGPGAQRRPQL
jgi:hypothetical protein